MADGATRGGGRPDGLCLSAPAYAATAHRPVTVERGKIALGAPISTPEGPHVARIRLRRMPPADPPSSAFRAVPVADQRLVSAMPWRFERCRSHLVFAENERIPLGGLRIRRAPWERAIPANGQHARDRRRCSIWS